MKLKNAAAGFLSAALIASCAAPVISDSNGFCIVSEAASKLKAPELKSKSSTETTVTLTWKSVKGADGYIVYVFDPDTDEFEEYREVTGKKCVVTDLMSGVQYQFKLASYIYKDDERIVQKKSGIKRMTTKKLPAPTGLKAEAGDSQVTLSWNAVDGAALYRVYVIDAGTDEQLSVLDTDTTAMTVDRLYNNKKYKFKVASAIKNFDDVILQKTTGAVTAEPRKKAELQIPDFEVMDRNEKTYKLSGFAGKPIVVHFWTRWSLTAEKELAAYNELYKEYGDDVQFVLINCEGKSLKKFVWSYLDEHEITVPMLYDWGLTALEKCGYNKVPVTMFIDSDGKLVKTFDCGLSKSTIKNNLALIYDF